MSLVRYTVIAIIAGAALSRGGQRDTTAAGEAVPVNCGLREGDLLRSNADICC
jgi:hypothetical protein